jgi:ribosomal-protein-alanine N-acetyltransferase
MTVLRTPRLLLLQVTRRSLEAELISREALGIALSVTVPDSWPPELYDADAVRWTIAWLAEHPEEVAWSLYYVVKLSAESSNVPGVVGVVGFKGSPDSDGVVEIGYGVVPKHRRVGLASEAVRALLARAFADPRVTTVIAHTLPELTASIGVLRTTGFAYDGAGNDPHEPTAIRYVLPRARYDRLLADSALRSGSPAAATRPFTT